MPPVAVVVELAHAAARVDSDLIGGDILLHGSPSRCPWN